MEGRKMRHLLQDHLGLQWPVKDFQVRRKRAVSIEREIQDRWKNVRMGRSRYAM